MTIEICAVGGYNEVGKNMTAVKVDDEVVIIDMGFYLPAILALEDEERIQGMNYNQLKKIGGIPDDSAIKDWKDKVVAIALGHCHLDHIGAIPFMGNVYNNAPIIGTPYTIQVLRAILADEKVKIANKLKPLAPNSMLKISEKITIELVHVTHSTPQSAIVAVHTPYGVIIYANDFKFDNHPVLGNKPNYKRFKELGKKGVIALIVESLYCDRESKTPSEEVARQMLKEVLNTDNEGKAIFVTTFASHLARIKSIIEFGRNLRRKIVIIGRSMGRYIQAGEDLKLVNFSKSAKLGVYKSQVHKILDEVEKRREKYLVICTGNQAEPRSILDRIVNNEFKFRFRQGDHVIFSCKTIPADMNLANREALESKLKNQSVRLFKDIHVSGHSSKEDLRDFINMLKPANIIPAHGENKMKKAFLSLAEEEGYDLAKNVILLNDGQRVVIE